MRISEQRRFPPPWTAVRESADTYQIRDANGVTLAWIFCRDDERRYSFGASKLTAEEARRLANGFARLPEFMMQRRGFFVRGSGSHRWNPKRPYHVALEDTYLRTNWFAIDAICKLNSLPFDPTGEVIKRDGTWRVHEFTWQMDAILFWNRFQGRWLRSDEFHYPEAPQGLAPLKEIAHEKYARRRPER